MPDLTEVHLSGAVMNIHTSLYRLLMESNKNNKVKGCNAEENLMRKEIRKRKKRKKTKQQKKFATERVRCDALVSQNNFFNFFILTFYPSFFLPIFNLWIVKMSWTNESLCYAKDINADYLFIRISNISANSQSIEAFRNVGSRPNNNSTCLSYLRNVLH